MAFIFQIQTGQSQHKICNTSFAAYMYLFDWLAMMNQPINFETSISISHGHL